MWLTCLRRRSLSSELGRLTHLPQERLRVPDPLNPQPGAQVAAMATTHPHPTPADGAGRKVRHGEGAGPEVRSLASAAFLWVAAILPLRWTLRVRSLTLPPYRLSLPRRAGSPERRSHAGRTRAGGAPAAASNH